MITREEIKQSLPHGSLKEVAAHAGVSVQAVTRYFKGKIKTSPTIEKAALEIALKYKRELQPLIDEMQSMA